MTNHPTQGLQDMTLDLSIYSDTGLKELQARIEKEKNKRERKVPFKIFGTVSNIHIECVTPEIGKNLDLRLSAEAKLRAAGGGVWDWGNQYALFQYDGEYISASLVGAPTQGAIFFKSYHDAIQAAKSLTPDEQAAIFGFGEG